MTLTVCIVVFVLAMFLGREVITKVPATLHTPLMSGSNAISGITVVGAIVAVAVFGRSTEETNTMAAVLGAAAVFFASINVFGGFAVTDRMLQMFKKR
jgi:NAD(P) transhydrogenase subunit alpha